MRPTTEKKEDGISEAHHVPDPAFAMFQPIPVVGANAGAGVGVGAASAGAGAASASMATGAASTGATTRQSRSQIRTPAARLARSLSDDRAATVVSSFSGDTNRQLSELAGKGKDISKTCLYDVLYQILRESNQRNLTHPVYSLHNLTAFKERIAEYIDENLNRYIHDLALEVNEIATRKRANRFIGPFQLEVDEFIRSSDLSARLNNLEKKPKAVKDILDFLTKPDTLKLYYDFIKTANTPVSDLELKAIVHLFEINLTLFRDSLRLTITHNPRRPHVYLHNRAAGVYRQLSSIESLRPRLEPTRAIPAGRDLEGSRPFIALTSPLTAAAASTATARPHLEDSRTGAGAGAGAETATGVRAIASDDGLLSPNASELALIKKLHREAIKAVTGPDLSLEALQVIIPDKFSFNQLSFEKDFAMQGHKFAERVLRTRLHLVRQKSLLLQALKLHLESSSTAPSTAVTPSVAATSSAAATPGAAATVDATKTPTSLAELKTQFLALIQKEILLDGDDLKKMLAANGWFDETDGVARLETRRTDSDGISLERLGAKYRAKLIENFNSLKLALNKWPNEAWFFTRASFISFVTKEINSADREAELIDAQAAEEINKKSALLVESYKLKEDHDKARAERFRILMGDAETATATIPTPTTAAATSSAASVSSAFPPTSAAVAAAPSAPIPIPGRGTAPAALNAMQVAGEKSAAGKILTGAGTEIENAGEAGTKASTTGTTGGGAGAGKSFTKPASALSPPAAPSKPSLAKRLAAAYPGTRASKLELILNEGLPVTIVTSTGNTLLHILFDNPLEFYNEELKLIADYLLRRGVSVSAVNEIKLPPPSYITNKTYMGSDKAKQKAAAIANEAFDLCAQAFAFEQQESEFLSIIDRFVEDMTGHLVDYKNLSQERQHHFWFKLFQTKAMNTQRAEDLEFVDSFLKRLQKSRYQFLDIVERIMNRSKNTWKGLTGCSDLHGGILRQSTQLQDTYEYRRATLTVAGVGYDYWELMTQQYQNSFSERIKQVQREADRQVAEARAETESVRLEGIRNAADAAKRAADADKRAADADKKIADADKRAADADKKIADADKRAADADKRAAGADKRAAGAIAEATMARAETQGLCRILGIDPDRLRAATAAVVAETAEAAVPAEPADTNKTSPNAGAGARKPEMTRPRTESLGAIGPRFLGAQNLHREPSTAASAGAGGAEAEGAETGSVDATGPKFFGGRSL